MKRDNLSKPVKQLRSVFIYVRKFSNLKINQNFAHDEYTGAGAMHINMGIKKYIS